MSESLQRYTQDADSHSGDTKDMSAATASATGASDPAGKATGNSPERNSANHKAAEQNQARRRETTNASQSNGHSVSTAKPAERRIDFHDPALAGHLATAVTSCRGSRQPLSLVLVEVDQFDEVILTRGMSGADQVIRVLLHAAQLLDEEPLTSARISDSCFALVLSDYDRQQAVELADRLIQGVRRWPQTNQQSPASGQISVSLGVASVSMPAKNFDQNELIAAAGRCLDTARHCGGDTLKSIDIY